ncbi:MAG: hypothetical protein ACYCSG_06320 [Thermoplasmataceae archaeon]
MNDVEEPQKVSSTNSEKIKERVRSLMEIMIDPDESEDEFIERCILEALEYKETKKNLEMLSDKVQDLLAELREKEKTLSEERRKFAGQIQASMAPTPQPTDRKTREEAHRIHWNNQVPATKKKTINTEIEDLISHLESRWAQLDQLDLEHLRALMEKNHKKIS